ncbi:MAG: SRPBCC family protein [Myxococcota bacterium]
MRIAAASIVGVALALSAASAMAAKPNPLPWEKIDTSDGIDVWAREVPGSNVREVKAEAIINLPAETVWAVLYDVKKYSEFMPYLIKGYVLGPAGPNAQYEYQLIDPPIVDKRDYTLKVTVHQDHEKGLYTRTWVPANDKGPKAVSDVVRVTICEGAWTVEKLGSRSTRLEYRLYTDPGGSIPSWIADKANTTSVPDLLNAVRQRSFNPKWKKDD